MERKQIREEIKKIIIEMARYYKTYTGKVIDVDDSEKRGRVKCYILELYWVDGDSAVWIEPQYINQMLKLQKDDYVTVGFKNGDRKRPFYYGKCDELKDMKPDKYDGTKQVLFESNKGDLFITYSDDDKEYILTVKKDDSYSNTITINKDGMIIKDCNDNKYTLNKDGTKIEDKNNNKYEMTNTGTKLTDKNNMTIETTSSAVKINDVWEIKPND